jgi:hypothetical protein
LGWQSSLFWDDMSGKINARSTFPRPDKRKIENYHILCLARHQSGSVSPVTFPNTVNRIFYILF